MNATSAVTLNWAGRPLPRNVFGGLYSTQVEPGLRQGAWRVPQPTPERSPRPARAWRPGDAVLRRPGDLGGVCAPVPLEAPLQHSSQATSPLLSTKHCRLRGRIERCPQVRKSAPVRVHGYESGREPTTATLACQGLRTQVPRHTVFTCLRTSRPGSSRAAGGSATPSKGSTVAPYDTAEGRKVGQASRDPRSR